MLIELSKNPSEKNNSLKLNSSDIPLVIFPLAKWDSPYSSTTFSLAKEFSKKNKVIYVDAPVTLKDVIFNFKRPDIKKRLVKLFKGDIIQEYNSNLTICYLPPVLPNNFLSKGKIYDSIKSFNEWVIFKFLAAKLRKLRLLNFIYINVFNPFYNPQKYLKPLIHIYYTVDNISKSSHIYKHGTWLEIEYMKQSNLVLGTSKMLVQSNSRYNNHIYYLPNAADLKIFNPDKKHSIPKEIAHIKTKIIIFTGHLDKRNNIDLLFSILKLHEDKTLVIVGFISINEKVINQLKEYKNILFVSAKPLEELPAFLHHSDCAIIPFKNNELTQSIYPLKINEYLAMGIPVISTCFSEDIMQFKQVVKLTNDPEKFNFFIDSEIKNNTESKKLARMEAAKANTWENRVTQFWSILEKHINIRKYA